MKKMVYIAETNGDGRVDCVWVSTSGDRPARVYDPKLHKFDPHAAAEYSGASKVLMQSWIKEREVGRTGGARAKL